MELPYTIFALGDAQLHQLHTEAGKVRGFENPTIPLSQHKSSAECGDTKKIPATRAHSPFGLDRARERVEGEVNAA